MIELHTKILKLSAYDACALAVTYRGCNYVKRALLLLISC